MIDDLKKQIEDLKKQVKDLEERRIAQQMIIPGAIKMRHMGEANRFVRAGTSDGFPDPVETATDSLAMYYDTTNHKLWVFDGTWKGVTLS